MTALHFYMVRMSGTEEKRSQGTDHLKCEVHWIGLVKDCIRGELNLNLFNVFIKLW